MGTGNVIPCHGSMRGMSRHIRVSLGRRRGIKWEEEKWEEGLEWWTEQGPRISFYSKGNTMEGFEKWNDMTSLTVLKHSHSFCVENTMKRVSRQRQKIWKVIGMVQWQWPGQGWEPKAMVTSSQTGQGWLMHWCRGWKKERKQGWCPDVLTWLTDWERWCHLPKWSYLPLY